MDYIELLEKYMQGLTTPEEEKALLDWIQHDGDARSTISAFYEKRWKETPDTGVSAELQYKMLMNIKQNICQHETDECNEVCSCDIGYNGRFCIFCLLFLFLRK